MQNNENSTRERFCPGCGSDFYMHFADEHIDRQKVGAYTYASRKQPEFMCLRLVRCLACDLVYAPTPPDFNFLSGAYSEAAFDSGPEAQAAAISYSVALAPYVERLKLRNAAVDVGAGSGPLLPWLIKNGFSPVIGIEPSRAAIEAAPDSVRVLIREGMFSRSLLADVRPSLICSFMTLEHLADPGVFTKTAFDLLEPSGMLAVVVHNWRAPLNRILGLRSPIIDVEHLQLFSPKAARSLLRRAGFDAIELRTISNAYPLRYWVRLTPFPLRIKVFIIKVLEHIGLADLVIPMRVGNMLAIGIKPLEN